MALEYLKRVWLRWNLSRAAKGEDAAIDRLYLVSDPWRLRTRDEGIRFEETKRIIQKRIAPRMRSILEIGCGEGLQTRYLAAIADEVVGIDPSLNAIRRASTLGIRNATFEVGELTNICTKFGRRFELVTACEVIYYMPDLEAAYRRLNCLAEHQIVSYYRGAFERLDRFFEKKPVSYETIRSGSGEWRVVWWGAEH